MIQLELKRKPINEPDFFKRSAFESDFNRLIKDDTLIMENGEPVILYMALPKEETKFLRQAVKNIKYEKSTRTNGVKTESRIFGFNPRNPIRKNFCSRTSLAEKFPTEDNVICSYGEHLAKIYQQYFPKVYARHTAIVEEKVLPEWKICNSPFTSGIVNKNNPLKYHFDSGNFSEVLSNMVVFKRDIGGGMLAVPEFDIGLECADNTLVIFDGQKILHGVTPIEKQSVNGYRYSVVYYSLKQMWNCLPLGEELAKIRNSRTQREKRRAAGQFSEMQTDAKVKNPTKPSARNGKKSD